MSLLCSATSGCMLHYLNCFWNFLPASCLAFLRPSPVPQPVTHTHTHAHTHAHNSGSLSSGSAVELYLSGLTFAPELQMWSLEDEEAKLVVAMATLMVYVGACLQAL
ncbi:hypothetical protein ILYODFUR_030743 [Ilyodon furcidens]|uniref:Uncharacterized protein n=1 Tax=Ilyodon furcidens TaxID=33524 RepID=A0ABV0UXY8_9TELE